jgi:hypothetical protein
LWDRISGTITSAISHPGDTYRAVVTAPVRLFVQPLNLVGQQIENQGRANHNGAMEITGALVSGPSDFADSAASHAAGMVTGLVSFVADGVKTEGRVAAGLATHNLGAAGRAIGQSQTAHLATTVARETESELKMRAALVTGNRTAFVNAAQSSPLAPLVSKVPTTVNRIREAITHPTADQTAGLIHGYNRFAGAAFVEAVTFAVPGGEVGGAASLAARSARLAAEGADLTRGARTVEELVAARYGTEHWQQIQGKLDQLMKSDPADVATRQRLMSELSEEMNIPSLAKNDGKLAKDIPKGEACEVRGGVGGGNCLFSALNSLDAFAHGGLSSPLTYANGTKFEQSYVSADEFLSERGLLVAGRENTDMAGVEQTLTRRLRDGQMAVLTSYSDLGGHGTIVVKLGDKLYHVNNQGWATQPTLQTLAEWDRTWRAVAKDQSSVHYGVYVTPLTVGGK